MNKKIVAIEWVDASFSDIYYQEGEDYSVPSLTVGIMEKKNKKGVILTTTLYHTDGERKFVNFIPSGVIRKVTVLGKLETDTLEVK